MNGPDPRALRLLPALGLCSCVAAGGQVGGPTAEPRVVSSTTCLSLPLPLSRCPHGRTYLEAELEREPPTMLEAATRSVRESLAAGHYTAARASIRAARAYDPDQAALTELEFAEVDALIGLRDFEGARHKLWSLREPEQRARVDARLLDIREHANAIGVDRCALDIDVKPRALLERDDFIEAWSDLRLDGQPYPASQIPTTASDARRLLCPACEDGQPAIATLPHERAVAHGLVIARPNGQVTVLPELLSAETQRTGCDDEPMLALERDGLLLRVRAINNGRAPFDPSAWQLGPAAALGGADEYAADRDPWVSSGYQSSGYASSGYASSGHASSGYQSSGYASSGYAYTGYGYGYDYGYDCGDGYEEPQCMTTHVVERDVFIDLARGEVVLDIVRTGPPTSPLGLVTYAAGEVRIDACGVQRSLAI